jgi:predicted AAA+ superfamily ATPase
MGSLWEGFALEEVLRVTGDRDAYFWRTQGGAALDLLAFLNGERFGFEFKYADVPTVTRSLQVARHDLRLRRALVVHPGPNSYSLNEWADAVSIRELRRRVKQLADAE